MPLIPPALDDRAYGDLVAEMLANIPAHTPEWTNPQPGDPGRTLIELFAWLADTILYRANLVPEKQRIAFLRLLGQNMLPAAAARGLVSLSLDASATVPKDLLAGATLTGPVAFETLAEIDVLPLGAQAYVKAKVPPEQSADVGSLLTGLRTLYGLSSTPSGYLTTAVFTNGQGDATGIDLQQSTVDGCMWLALLAAKPELVASVRDSIGGKYGQQLLSVGFVPAIAPADPFADVGPRSAAQATWQMTSAPPGSDVAFTTLAIVDDTTQGLTRAGVVRLAVPQSADISAPTNDVRADARAGVGPKPPRVDDADVAGRLVTWVRLNASSALTVSWLGINAVEIDQRTTFTSVVVGVSDGTAGQQFALARTQIDPATFELEVDTAGLGYQLWRQVDDLAVLQGPDPAYVLDPEAGTVTFGDQMHGMIVPIGRRIRVRRMRAGGGAAGNLPSGSLTSIQARDATGAPAGQIKVLQPVATSGGDDAETLAHAESRIPGLLRHQDRAVTAGDYQTLAMSVPGGPVARVEVLPLFKPQTRATNVPGVVSVMVLPRKDTVQPPCPRADRPLLETVYQYLDARRPVAAEMYVIGTDYAGLGIAVAVEVRSGYGLSAVGAAVETALRTYLWPIPPGGSDGGGWPLGRNVRSLELEVIVSQVPGVVEVNGLELYAVTSGVYEQLPVDASGKSTLTLAAWQLVELLAVSVATGTDGSGVAVPPLVPPPVTDDSVAVPVVPKVC
ncbi:MAG TPA: putative baseplate assembly protein [Candidatus Elarobacter sp.]|nr:putative baseplate assembly protein [Candidatus Elarobacter sp.]